MQVYLPCIFFILVTVFLIRLVKQKSEVVMRTRVQRENPRKVLDSMGLKSVNFKYVGRRFTPRSQCQLLSVPKIPKGISPYCVADLASYHKNGLDAVSAVQFVRENPNAEHEDERIIFAGARWKSRFGFDWVLVSVARNGKRVLDIEDYLALFFTSDTLRSSDRFAVSQK